MGLQFERPVGSPLDVCELEYCAALRQTDTSRPLRANGSLSADDVRLHILSRHGIEVSREAVERQILVELAGGHEYAVARRATAVAAASSAKSQDSGDAFEEDPTEEDNGKDNAAGLSSSVLKHQPTTATSLSLPSGQADEPGKEEEDEEDGGLGEAEAKSDGPAPRSKAKRDRRVTPLDLVQQVSLLLIPELKKIASAEAAKRKDEEEGEGGGAAPPPLSRGLSRRRSSTVSQSVRNLFEAPSADDLPPPPAADPSCVELALLVLLESAGLPHGVELTADALHQVLISLGEEHWKDEVIEQMIEAARAGPAAAVAQGSTEEDAIKGKVVLDTAAFLRALTSDIQLYDERAELTDTTHLSDVNANPAPSSASASDSGKPDPGRAPALQRPFFTAPSIDFTADTYASLIWAVIVWFLLAGFFFQYMFDGLSRRMFPLSCDSVSFGCSVANAVVLWLEIMIKVCAFGFVFISLASLGNSVYLLASDRDSALDKLKASAAILVSLATVFASTFLAYLVQVDAFLFDTTVPPPETYAPTYAPGQGDDMAMVTFDDPMFSTSPTPSAFNFADPALSTTPAPSAGTFDGSMLTAAPAPSAGTFDGTMLTAAPAPSASFPPPFFTTPAPSGPFPPPFRFLQDVAATSAPSSSPTSGRRPMDTLLAVTLILGAICMISQLLQLARVLLPRYLVAPRFYRLFNSAAIDRERRIKEAASHKARQLLQNAASCHSLPPNVLNTHQLASSLKYDAKNPARLLALNADGRISHALVQFQQKLLERETVGGLVYTIKGFLRGGNPLATKEGIWVFPRLLWCHLGQWFVVVFFIVLAVQLPIIFSEGLGIEGISVQQFQAVIVTGGIVAIFTCLSNVTRYLPSAVTTVLSFRAGAHASLRDNRRFHVYRYAQDTSTALFGSSIWGLLFSGIIIWFVVFAIVFGFVWESTREIFLLFLSQIIGIVVTIVIKVVLMQVLRRTWYGGFYRKRIAGANIFMVLVECWNLALSSGYILARSIKFILLSIIYIARVDTPFLAEGAGYLVNQIPLDAYAISFRKDLLIHEAHRHPYMERWAMLYLLKIRHGSSFGTPAGAAWRILLTLALMPWLRNYRVHPSLGSAAGWSTRHSSAMGQAGGGSHEELFTRNQQLELEIERLKHRVAELEHEGSNIVHL